MDKRIYVLSLASFAFGTQTYVFAALLDEIAVDLGVTVGMAGQLASVFALVYALSAPVIAPFVAGWPRRPVLVCALLAVAALNVAAALASTYAALLGIRMVAALASTLVNPIAAAAAASMVPVEQRGKALAVVLAGLTLSFSFGIPAGSAIGEYFGWRGTFAFVAALSAIAAGLTLAILPPVPGSPTAGLAALRDSVNGRVATNLSVTMLAFAAIFCVTAYVGPVVASVTGFSPKQIGLMQSFVGLGSIAGVAIGGAVAGRTHSSFAVVAILAIVSLVTFAYTPLMSADSLPPSLAIAALALLIFLGAAALFSLTPIIQVRLIDCAPRATNVVLAMNAAMLFLGQAIGASVGGLVADQLALRWLGVAGAFFGLCGVALALAVRRRNARAAA